MKITINSMYLWEKFLNKTFKNNDKIILLSFNGENYKMHFRILHGLTRINDNNNLNIKLLNFWDNNSFLAFSNENDLSEYKIINCVQFIENICLDFLIIKNDKINNFYKTLLKNKDIITIELHSNFLSRNDLVTAVDIRNLNFSEKGYI